MQIMLITIIIICILFTVFEITISKINPIAGVHNLPKDIQERVHNIPEYNGKMGKILSTKERIVKKIPALVLVLFVFAALVHMAGADDFLSGFGYALGLWVAVKLYVTIVLTCGLYAHSPSVWIPGTEDMKASYQNYKFYLSSIPRSILAGTIVAAVIGIMMEII